MHIFLKKQIAVPIIIFCEWMPHWMPLKNPTRWVSEGCPLSTEWEVIERGFWGCARARGRIWRVSPGRVPPSKATFMLSYDLGPIPNKLGGVIALAISIAVLYTLPFYIRIVVINIITNNKPNTKNRLINLIPNGTPTILITKISMVILIGCCTCRRKRITILAFTFMKSGLTSYIR